MTFGSLFAGIGGIDLGLERAGMTCAWQVERDPFCLEVLARHWPAVPRHSDIHEVSASNLTPVDCLAGGFPCQPHSVAGARKGFSDSRDLWPQFLRLIRELRPRWVVGENVPGIDSTILAAVLADLEGEGYRVTVLGIPACGVGAPHRRERRFIIAHSISVRSGLGSRGIGGGSVQERESANAPESAILRQEHGPTSSKGADASGADVADTASYGQQGRQRQDRESPSSESGKGRMDTARESEVVAYSEGADASGEDVADAEGEHGRAGLCQGGEKGEQCRQPSDGGSSDATDADDTRRQKQRVPVPDVQEHAAAQRDSEYVTDPRLGHGERPGCEIGSSEWPSWWATEPDVGRVANGVPRRVDRLRALGNAVVPQVAQWVGQMVMAADTGETNND